MSSTTTSLGNQVLSGLIWSAVRNWGGRLAGIVIFFLLARILSPEEFGVFAAAAAVLAFIEIFAEQGLGDAIVQKPNIGPAELNTAFLANFILAALLVAGIWWGAPLIASAMAIERLTEILRVACLGILINALGFCQQALLRRNFQYRWLAVRTLVSTVLSGAAGVWLALSGFGVWSLVGQFLTNALVNLILVWIKPIWKPGLGLSFEGFGKLFRYGGNILGMRLLDFANTRMIELAIGAWLGAATLGLYAVGSRIYAILMQLLSSVVLDVAHAGFSRIAGERGRLTEAYYRAMTATAALAVPCLVLVAAVAQELCVVAFGTVWAGSADILQPLALLGAVQAMQYYNGTGLNAIGKPGISLLIVAVRSAATVVVLVATRGCPLSVIVETYVLSQFLTSSVSFYFGRKYLGVSIRRIVRLVSPFVAASAALYFAVKLSRPWIEQVAGAPMFKLPLLALAGGIAYTAFALVLARKPLMNAAGNLKGRRQQTSIHKRK
jgi:O-antigen/teichoic acid export membrane protein